MTLIHHKDFDTVDHHKPGYVQGSDPGVIGAGRLWVDTSLGAGAWQAKIRKLTDDGWERLQAPLTAADIPSLDAAKITTGILSVARIPDLDAAKITTGQIALARGGAGADLSATGAGHLVQATVGANLSVIKDNFAAVTAPTVNEDSGDGYAVGSVWYDTTGDQIYLCVDASVGAAVWRQVAAGGTETNLLIAEGDKSGDISTTSGSFVDITGVSITTTVPTGRCLLWFQANISNNTANEKEWLRFLANGSPLSSAGSTDGDGLVPTSNGMWYVHMLKGITGLDTGASHTFKMQWRRSAGTATIQNDAAGGAWQFGVAIL